MSTARTQYKNIIDTLEGTIVAGNEHGYFVKGKVVVGIGTPEVLQSIVEDDDLVIIGDREDAQLICIEQNCSCLIVTNGFEISQEVLEAKKCKRCRCHKYSIRYFYSFKTYKSEYAY